MQLVFLLFIFNALYMCCNIRCDEKSEKFYKSFWKLNKALNDAPLIQIWFPIIFSLFYVYGTMTLGPIGLEKKKVLD